MLKTSLTLKIKKMNLQKLNLVELNAQEMKKTEGGLWWVILAELAWEAYRNPDDMKLGYDAARKGYKGH